MSEVSGQGPEQHRQDSYEEGTRIMHDDQRWAALTDRFRGLVAEFLSLSVEVGPGISWGIYAQDNLWNALDEVEEKMILVAHSGAPIPPYDESQPRKPLTGTLPGVRLNALAVVKAPVQGGQTKKVLVMEDLLLPKNNNNPRYRFDSADMDEEGFAVKRHGSYVPFEYGVSDDGQLYASDHVMMPPSDDSFTITSAMTDEGLRYVCFADPYDPRELWGALSAGRDMFDRIQTADPIACGYLEQ